MENPPQAVIFVFMEAEDFLKSRLEERRLNDSFRALRIIEGMVDLCSNDYLGIVKNHLIRDTPGLKSGSTGSRLLAGNYPLIEELEREVAIFHKAEAALIFNSGYDANLGLLASVPQKGDTIIYDKLSHASLRDGIRLSFAQSYSFAHNDMEDLGKKLDLASGNIFVVTESVFSMDGDLAPLNEISQLCTGKNAKLIVDEAHATGVMGHRGEGLVQELKLENACFARIHTFGKALGAHGAVVLGSQTLRDFLINFARPLIYTTALPEVTVAAVRQAYTLFPIMMKERQDLLKLIMAFNDATIRFERIPSSTPVQAVLVPGNSNVRELANILQNRKLDVRPIVYPTVPKNSERLRIVLHSYNTEGELNELIGALS